MASAGLSSHRAACVNCGVPIGEVAAIDINTCLSLEVFAILLYRISSFKLNTLQFLFDLSLKDTYIFMKLTYCTLNYLIVNINSSILIISIKSFSKAFFIEPLLINLNFVSGDLSLLDFKLLWSARDGID